MKYQNDFTEFSGLKGRDAATLDGWLEQYQVKNELSEVDNLFSQGEYSEKEMATLKSAVSDFNDDLAAGQIRIWGSEMVKDKKNPPYFAVISEWDNDMWLVAPFSPLGLPANGGEMATELDIPFCETLQCWNARTVQSCLVARSWLVGTLPETIIQAAKDLFLNLTFGDELPENFSFLRGGPVLTQLDPRIRFLRQSKEQFSPLHEKVMQLNFFRSQQTVVLFDQQEDEEGFQLAAADLKKTITKHFISAEFRCQVTLTIVPDEDPEIFIIDDVGNDFIGLDGFSIRNRKGKILATIQGGNAIIPAAEFDGTLLITKPDGWPIALQGKED